MRSSRSVTSILALALALAVVACGPSDPRDRMLTERARWNVDLTNWAAVDAGGMLVSLRVSGPVHSKLEQLTLRFDIFDAMGNKLDEVWHTIDLTRVKRGGPKDLDLRLASEAQEVDHIALDRVESPTAEQEPFIKELSGL